MKYDIDNFGKEHNVEILFNSLTSNFKVSHYMGSNQFSKYCELFVEEDDEPIKLIFESALENKYFEYLLKKNLVTIKKLSEFPSIGKKYSTTRLSNLCKAELNEIGEHNHSYEDIIWYLIYNFYYKQY